MANGTLSSYFEKEKAKGTKAGGVSPYSAPVEPTGGTAPMGGGSSPSAPKAAPGGGTGFVSFGQYFGANAPAVQAQAQKAVETAGAPKAPTAPAGATGLGMARPERFGPMASAGTMAARQKAGSSADPYAAQIAQTSAQFAALNPAVQSGDMGEGVGAFDQLLGGGETKRAAKAEQQRLGTLRAALEGEQNQFRAEQSRMAQEQAQAAKTKNEADAYKAWVDRLSPWYKENKTEAELQQMFKEQMPEGSYTQRSKEEAYASWVNTLSPWYKQNYTDEQLRTMFDEQVPPEQYTDKKAPGLVG
jgi:hypothetical protein